MEILNREEIRQNYNIPLKRFVAVFGGQLVPGRGISEIIEVASLASLSVPDLLFLIIGSGSLKTEVDEYIANGNGNLMYIPDLARTDYLNLISACDVGLVATVADVAVPTFPSKTIDYLRAGLPIVATVERTTDYGEFLVDNGLGVAVEAGNPDLFLSSLVASMICGDMRVIQARTARHRVLSEVFSVESAAERILNVVSS